MLGGEYQLLIFSTLLSRKIIIYGSFKDKNNDWYQPITTNISEIQKLFQNNECRTDMHNVCNKCFLLLSSNGLLAGLGWGIVL